VRENNEGINGPDLLCRQLIARAFFLCVGREGLGDKILSAHTASALMFDAQDIAPEIMFLLRWRARVTHRARLLINPARAA